MPGLYGIVGENIDQAKIRLTNAVKKRLYVHTHFEKGNVCFGRTSHGLFFPSQALEKLEQKGTGGFAPREEVFWDSSGKYAIIIDGYLVIKDNISDCTDKAQETLSLLLESYIRNGDDMVKEIKTGVFNILIYDSLRSELKLLNDRFGINPLYYCSGKSFVFSHSIESILRTEEVEQEADAIALAELLILGYPLRDRTPIKELRLMPAASVLTYSIAEKTVSIRKYYVDKYIRQPSGRYSYHDYADKAISLFRQACQRLYLPDKRYCIMLSGGWDSRLILASWPSRKIFSLSWGESESVELRIARKVSRIAGVESHILQLEGDAIADALQECFHEVGNVRYPHRLPGAQVTKQLGADIAIDGFIGGTIFGGRSLDIRGNSLDQIVDMISTRLGGDLYKKFLKEDAIRFFDRAKDDIRKDIKLELEQFLKAFDPAERTEDLLRELASLFKINIRGRRGIAQQGIVTRTQLEAIYPYIDYDLYDFFLRIPPDVIVEQNLFREIFKCEYPQYASIAWSGSLLPVRLPTMLHSIVSEHIVKIIFDVFFRTIRQRLRSHFPMIMWQTWDNWDRWMRSGKFKDALWEILSDSGIIDLNKSRATMDEYEEYKLFLYGLPVLSLLSFALWVKKLDWNISP